MFQDDTISEFELQGHNNNPAAELGDFLNFCLLCLNK